MIGQGYIIVAAVAYIAGVASYPAGRATLRKIAEKIVAYAAKVKG